MDDQPVNGINFYRLKIIDKNGSFDYSAIKMIDNSIGFVTRVYPNPAHNYLSLKVESERKMGVRIELLNNERKIVLTSKATLPVGSSHHLINIASLSAGTYSVRVYPGSFESVVMSEKL